MKFRDLVLEEYYQNLVRLEVVVRILKDVGGSRGEVQNDIRALAGVTTVKLVPEQEDRARHESHLSHVQTYSIGISVPRAMDEREALHGITAAISEMRGVEVGDYRRTA